MAYVYYTHYFVQSCTKESGLPLVINLEKRHLDTDSAPTPVRISGGKVPVVISYKDQGDYKIIPIQGSEAKISLISDEVFSGIEAQDEQEWRISVMLDSALYWRGFVLPDDGAEPFSTKPFPISVRATDIIGTLKDVPYSDVGEIIYKGRITQLDLLCKILNKTKLGLDIVIADNTFEREMDRTLNTAACPWPQTQFSNTRYYDQDRRPFSCYDILKSILSMKSCVLRQVAGKWYIINQEENNRALEGIYYRSYNKDGGLIGNSVLNTWVQLGGNDKQAVISASNKTLRNAKAFLSVTAYYQYGYSSTQIQNGSFDDWPVPLLLPAGWKWIGAVAVNKHERLTSTGVATGDYQMRIIEGDNRTGRNYAYNETPVQIKANESVTISFDIAAELGAGNNYTVLANHDSYMHVILMTDDQYAWDGTQWLKFTTYPNQTKIRWKKGEWQISNVDYGYGLVSERKTVTINLPPRDVDYKLTLGLGTMWRKEFLSDDDKVVVMYDNVEVRPSVSDEVLKPPLGRYVTHVQDKPLSYTPEPILILNGDDTNDQRTSWIKIKQGGIFDELAPIYSHDWYRRGEILPTPLLSIIAGNAMQLHSRPYKIFEVDSVRSGILPYSRVDVELLDSHYIFLAGDFDLLNETARLVLAEQVSGVATVTEYVAEDYGSFKTKSGVTIGQIGGITNPIPGTGVGGNGGGVGGGQTNRFQEVILIDPTDHKIARITTDFDNSYQIYSKTDELVFEITEIDDTPPEMDIEWSLDEGGGASFTELNLHFRKADGSLIADYWSTGSGIVSPKPLAGEMIEVQVSYYGGVIDEATGLPIEEWDSPVNVKLEVLKNGISQEVFTHLYDTPPPAGSLAQIRFVPGSSEERWEVTAKAERTYSGTLTVNSVLGAERVMIHESVPDVGYLGTIYDHNTIVGITQFGYTYTASNSVLSVQINNNSFVNTIEYTIDGGTLKTLGPRVGRSESLTPASGAHTIVIREG